MKNEIREWLASPEARSLGSLMVGMLMLCVLSASVALFVAWRAPSMTEICSQCSCRGKGGKAVPAAYVPSRPAGKTDNIRK